MAQEHQNNNQDERLELFSYDPGVVIRDVLKRWYLIAAAAILLGMGAFVGRELTYRPDYTTTTTFVVSARGNSTTVYQNLSAATGLAPVFSEVLNSSLLRSTILKETGLPGFDGTIRAEAVAETNLLTLEVTAHDPRTAFLVTKSIIRNHREVSYQVMGDTVLEVLQQPRVPSVPSNPMNAAGYMKKAALLGGVVVAVLLAAISMLRDTVRSRQEAEEKLDGRLLGQLQHEGKLKHLRHWLKHPGTGVLITDPETSFSFVERIRKLRRQVEQRMPDGGRVLLVTSALEHEGKTTVAANLALSLAQKGKRVLLIDVDLHRPTLYRLLGETRREHGAADVVRGAAAPEEVVFPWARQRGLNLLPEWEQRQVASGLVSSPGMAELLDWARARYDLIVLDTPPMSVAPDAECLADLADASVLVVQQDKAAARTLNTALDVLRQAKGKLLGYVLNDMQTAFFSESGGYGYGYGYGYGGSGYGYGYGSYGKYGTYGKYGKYGRYGEYADTRKRNKSDHEAGNSHEA